MVILCPTLWVLTPHIHSLVFSQWLKGTPYRFPELFLCVPLSSHILFHKFHSPPQITLALQLCLGIRLGDVSGKCLVGRTSHTFLLSGITAYCPASEIVAPYTLFSFLTIYSKRTSLVPVTPSWLKIGDPPHLYSNLVSFSFLPTNHQDLSRQWQDLIHLCIPNA